MPFRDLRFYSRNRSGLRYKDWKWLRENYDILPAPERSRRRASHKHLLSALAFIALMFSWNPAGHLALFQNAGSSQLIGGARVPVTPTDSPGAGSYGSTQSVTLASVTSTKINYTTDGSSPACPSTGTLYTGAISVAATTTIKAIGCNGITASGVLSSTYTITGGGSITRVGGTSCILTSGAFVDCPYTSTTSNAIVVGCISFGASITTAVATDGTNTYTQDFFFADGLAGTGNEKGSLSHSFDITGGTRNIRCTFSGSPGNGNAIILIEEYAGASSVDATAVTGSDSGNAASSGNIVTSSSAGLLVGLGLTSSAGNPATMTPTSGFTVTRAILNGTLSVCGAILDRITTASGTYSQDMTVDNGPWGSGVVALK